MGMWKQIFRIALAVCLLTGISGATDFESELYNLGQSIHNKWFDPKDPKVTLEEYLSILDQKGKDVARAKELAQLAEVEGNPYYGERFLDELETAVKSGNLTLEKAKERFLTSETSIGNQTIYEQWPELVHRSNSFGMPLFQSAVANGFDSDIIREAVRCLIRTATLDVEKGYLGIYHGREKAHGHQQDAEGNYYEPNMDYDSKCLPRSAYRTTVPGEPIPESDSALAWCERIRDVCESFELWGERIEATDLMNEYLIDALCILPYRQPNTDKGQSWYLELSERHKLEEAKKYIENFFGTVYGKVKVKEGDDIRPAPGALVTIKDPHDKKEWTTEADENGEYEINKTVLHKKCCPMDISAVYDGGRVNDKYQSPLENPIEGYRFRKDLLIIKKVIDTTWVWSGHLTLKESITSNCEIGPSEENDWVSWSEHIFNTQTAEVDLLMREIGLEKNAAAVAPIDKLQTFGSLLCVKSENSNYRAQPPVTICTKDPKRRSPGNWSIRRSGEKGMASCPIENISITILRDIFDQQARIQELTAQMQAAGTDVGKLEKLKEQMRDVMTGKGQDELKLKLAILVNSPCKGEVLINRFSQSHEVCLGKTTTHEDTQDTQETILGGIITLNMDGKYSVDPNGRANITAALDSTITMPGKNTYGPCPDKIHIISGKLELSREPE